MQELVARNVRRHRQERGLSLGELARRAGLSKQTLSKIEQGAGNPTVETLALLADALDIPARRLLTEWGTPVFVQRAATADWQGEPGRRERLLDEVFGTGYVRTFVARFEHAGDADVVIEAHPPGTLHHVLVLEGRLSVGPEADSVELGPGDFARFPADVTHVYRPLGGDALAHIVTTLPQLQQFDGKPLRPR